jgi:hypothetical protein
MRLSSPLSSGHNSDSPSAQTTRSHVWGSPYHGRCCTPTTEDAPMTEMQYVTLMDPRFAALLVGRSAPPA